SAWRNQSKLYSPINQQYPGNEERFCHVICNTRNSWRKARRQSGGGSQNPRAGFLFKEQFMSSAAQIAANQRNAQFSTGPKTEAGKAASSANSRKHGLCAKIPLLKSENPEDLQSLLDELFNEHQPVGITEETLVRKMAGDLINLDRAVAHLTTEIARIS